MSAQEHKPQIKATDMDQQDIDRVLQYLNQGLKASVKQNKQQKVLSRHLKSQMDRNNGSGWNCIVGKNFGAHVIHQAKKYVFLQVRQLSVLLWKA